jgi:transcription termination/antitermination protein NusG
MMIEQGSDTESSASAPVKPPAPPAETPLEQQPAEEMTPVVESDAPTERPAEETTPLVDSEAPAEKPADEIPPTQDSAEAPAGEAMDEEPTELVADVVHAEVPDEEPAEEPAPKKEEAKPASNKKWFVVKVQSGREESIRSAIERRVKIEGLEEYFGQVVVPIERVTEVNKDGKRVVKKRKKFPGYVMAEVEFNDKILYLFRETAGVGDFVGGGGLNRAPIPMSDREVHSMLRDQEVEAKGEIPKPVEPSKIPFNVGDKVRVNNGIFQGLEGEIKDIREPKDAGETHRIRVELTVFGRPTSVELEHWQIDAA